MIQLFVWPLEPGKRDCEVAISRLLDVLDDEKVVEAVWEMEPGPRAHSTGKSKA